jgi:hypothetical protein
VPEHVATSATTALALALGKASAVGASDAAGRSSHRGALVHRAIGIGDLVERQIEVS